MPRKPASDVRVNKNDFVKAVKSIQDKTKESEITRKLKKRGQFDHAVKFLEYLADQEWPEEVAPQTGFEINWPRIKAQADPEDKFYALGFSSLKNVIYVASECLEIVAQDRDLFETKILILKAKGLIRDVSLACRPCWLRSTPATSSTQTVIPAESPISRPQFSRVVVVGKLWDTEFSADFFRGLHAQADELGIQVADERTDERTFMESGEQQASDSKLKEVVRALKLNPPLNPQQDSILVYFDDPKIIKSDINNMKKEGLYFVTVGYENGTVTEDGQELGSDLGKQCIADERQWIERTGYRGEPRIAIALDFGIQGDAHNWSRTTGIHSIFKEQDILELKLIKGDRKLDINEYNNKNYKEYIESTISECGGINRVAAIFPRSVAMVREVIRWIIACNANTRVYSERLIASELSILRREGTPLWASCGVDPYHYGRVALRAASRQWEGKFREEKLPVTIRAALVTKDFACLNKVNSASRLPHLLDGVNVSLDDILPVRKSV